MSAKPKNVARTTNEAQSVQLAATAASDSGEKAGIGVGHRFVSRADRAKGVTSVPMAGVAKQVVPRQRSALTPAASHKPDL